jgi:hypothetical protein
MNITSPVFRIEQGFGTPEVNSMKPGDNVKLSTEFPGLLNDKCEKKPGALLFKLGIRCTKCGASGHKRSDTACPQYAAEDTQKEEPLEAILKYEDLQGITRSDAQNLEMKSEAFYQDSGIRKAILLVHYCQLITDFSNIGPNCTVNYHSLLSDFAAHFINEMSALNDPSLQQELEVLQKAITMAPDAGILR